MKSFKKQRHNRFGLTECRLTNAVIDGDMFKINHLLKTGANVNERSHNDWTPLHYASCYGHVEIAEFLLENGADLNARTSPKGNTPLHCATAYPEVVEVLLRAGADIEARTNDGWTPLHRAAFHDHDSVEYLIFCGANLRAKTDDGKHFSAMRNLSNTLLLKRTG